MEEGIRVNHGSVAEAQSAYLDFKVRLGKFPTYCLAEIGVITLPITSMTLLIIYQEIIAPPATHGEDLRENSNPTD